MYFNSGMSEAQYFYTMERYSYENERNLYICNDKKLHERKERDIIYIDAIYINEEIPYI